MRRVTLGLPTVSRKPGGRFRWRWQLSEQAPASHAFLQGARLVVPAELPKSDRLCLAVQLVQPDQFHLVAACGICELTAEPCARETDQSGTASVVLLNRRDEIPDPPEPR